MGPAQARQGAGQGQWGLYASRQEQKLWAPAGAMSLVPGQQLGSSP